MTLDKMDRKEAMLAEADRLIDWLGIAAGNPITLTPEQVDELLTCLIRLADEVDK